MSAEKYGVASREDARPQPEAGVAAKPLTNAYIGRSRGELKSLRRELLNARQAHLQEAARLLSEAQRVALALKEATNENIAVSDHAMLRWLERVQGVDMDRVRLDVIQAIHRLDRVGDARIIDGPNYRICMEESRVLTVLPLQAAYTPQDMGKRNGAVGDCEATQDLANPPDNRGQP